jgi:hypothetical protein
VGEEAAELAGDVDRCDPVEEQRPAEQAKGPGVVRSDSLHRRWDSCRGRGSDGMHLRGDGADLSNVEVTAADGRASIRSPQEYCRCAC